MLKITLGKAPVEEVLKVASTEEQRCEALFYGGEKALSDGNWKVALECFSECAKSGCKGIERRFAEIELEKLQKRLPQLENRSKVLTLAAESNRLWKQEKFLEAREIAWQNWDFARQALSESDPEFLVALQNVSMLCYLEHDFQSAIPLFERALVVLEQSFGPDNHFSEEYYSNLASMLRETGRSGSAIALLTDVARMRKARCGENSPEYASSLHNLAVVNLEVGNLCFAPEFLDTELSVFMQRLRAQGAAGAPGLV